MTRGGPAIPVSVTTEAPAGGPALPVYGYVPATLDRPVAGGPAEPVYLVSAAELAAGTFTLAGDPEPLALAALSDGRPVVGQRPRAVYVVGGSLVPVVASGTRITEAGDVRITEAGDTRVTE